MTEIATELATEFRDEARRVCDLAVHLEAYGYTSEAQQLRQLAARMLLRADLCMALALAEAEA